MGVSGLLVLPWSSVRTALVTNPPSWLWLGCGDTRTSRPLSHVHFSKAVHSSLFRVWKEARTGGAWKTPQAAWMRAWPHPHLLETWKKNRKPRPWEAGCKCFPRLQPGARVCNGQGTGSRAVWGELRIPHTVFPLAPFVLSKGDRSIRCDLDQQRAIWHWL